MYLPTEHKFESKIHWTLELYPPKVAGHENGIFSENDPFASFWCLNKFETNITLFS